MITTPRAGLGTAHQFTFSCLGRFLAGSLSIDFSNLIETQIAWIPFVNDGQRLTPRERIRSLYEDTSGYLQRCIRDARRTAGTAHIPPGRPICERQTILIVPGG